MTPPELDREHDPTGGACRALLICWVLVLTVAVALVAWWVTR